MLLVERPKIALATPIGSADNVLEIAAGAVWGDNAFKGTEFTCVPVTSPAKDYPDIASLIGGLCEEGTMVMETRPDMLLTAYVGYGLMAEIKDDRRSCRTFMAALVVTCIREGPLALYVGPTFVPKDKKKFFREQGNEIIKEIRGERDLPGDAILLLSHLVGDSIAMRLPFDTEDMMVSIH